MLRTLRCKLGLHRYKWFTVIRDAGGGWIALESYGRRTCCDGKAVLVDVEYCDRRMVGTMVEGGGR